MSNPLSEMTVLELEQESYRLNDEIQALRKQAIEVQNWLGKRNEDMRVSQLLGRPVQVVEIPTVEVPEDTATIAAKPEESAGTLA
ncbi:MAG: hypothetical protein ABL903_08450 [Methylococcales bacterium]